MVKSEEETPIYEVCKPHLNNFLSPIRDTNFKLNNNISNSEFNKWASLPNATFEIDEKPIRMTKKCESTLKIALKKEFS